MPGGDGTGPYKDSLGAIDGTGREKGGRGQSSKEEGSGSKTGGEKGECE